MISATVMSTGNAVERTFPLYDAADAMRHLASGHVRGKLVIIP